MPSKFLNDTIIPNLRAKFDDKVDKATYQAALESATSTIRGVSQVGSYWNYNWALRNIRSFYEAMEILGINLGGQTVTFPTDLTKSYGYPYTHLARLLLAANTRTSYGWTINYRRMAANGDKIDTAWQSMTEDKLVTVSDGSLVEIQVMMQNNSTDTCDFSLASFWTPGLVPLLDEYPKIWNANKTGEYLPLDAEDPTNGIWQGLGGYTQGGSNVYWRCRFTIDSTQCSNNSGLITTYGIGEAVGRTSRNAEQYGFGLNMRIV